MRLLFLITVLTLTLIACAQQTQQTASAPADGADGESVHPIANHPTVARIAWGKVPYERSEYSSSDWKSVRDSVCSAPTTFYTGESNDGPCEADHVLSVSEAHHRGAHRWSDEEKRSFYTDEANVVPSIPAVNRAKSNRTPAQVGTTHGTRPETTASTSGYGQTPWSDTTSTSPAPSAQMPPGSSPNATDRRQPSQRITHQRKAQPKYQPESRAYDRGSSHLPGRAT